MTYRYEVDMVRDRYEIKHVTYHAVTLFGGIGTALVAAAKLI